MANNCGNHKSIVTVLLRLSGDGTVTRKQLADWAKCSLSKVDQVLREEGSFNHSQIDGIIRMGFQLEIDDIRYRYVPQGYSVHDHKDVMDLVTGNIDNQYFESLQLRAEIISHWQDNADISSNAEGARKARKMAEIWNSVSIEFENRAKQRKPFSSMRSA